MPLRRRSTSTEHSFVGVSTTASSGKGGRGEPEGKRAAILEAALELFVERGFFGTAVPSVAERAGVAAGSIYRYFESKEALVNALYAHWKDRILESVLTEFPADADPRAQFEAVWARMTAFVGAHPRVYAFLELHHHAAYLDADNREKERRTYAFAAAVIAKGQTTGVVRPGPAPVLLALLHGAFVGLVRSWREGRISWSSDELEAARAVCWEILRKP